MTSSLLSLIGLVVVTGAVREPEAPAETRLFELRTYHVQDSRLDALHARFRDHAARLFDKHGITNLGYWVPTDAGGTRVVFLLAYPSPEARDASWARLVVDADWRRVRCNSEMGGRLVERIEEVLLKPTADCPIVLPGRGSVPRSFELRTYAVRPGDDRSHAAIQARYRKQIVGSWTASLQGNSEEVTHVYLLARERPGTPRPATELISADRFPISTTGGALVPSARPRPSFADGGTSLTLHPTDYSPLR